MTARATLTVLNSILGGGMSSRLFQEIREKRGLAYSVYSFSPSYSDAGLFGIYAGCSPAKTAQVAELMVSEFRGIASRGVTDEEMRRASGQLSGASALALEDSDTRMSRLGRSETHARRIRRPRRGAAAHRDGHARRCARAGRRTRGPPAVHRSSRHRARWSFRRTGRVASPGNELESLKYNAMSHYLYLVRHGEQQDAEYGLPDGKLSARGTRQAEAIANRLGGVPFSGAWHSPLERAADTARILTQRMPVAGVETERAADGLHPERADAEYAARVRGVLRVGHPRGDRGRRGADDGCARRVDGANARRHATTCSSLTTS